MHRSDADDEAVALAARPYASEEIEEAKVANDDACDQEGPASHGRLNGNAALRKIGFEASALSTPVTWVKRAIGR